MTKSFSADNERGGLIKNVSRLYESLKLLNDKHPLLKVVIDSGDETKGLVLKIEESILNSKYINRANLSEEDYLLGLERYRQDLRDAIKEESGRIL